MGRDVQPQSSSPLAHTHTEGMYNADFPTFQLVLNERTEGGTKPLIELRVRNLKKYDRNQ